VDLAGCASVIVAIPPLLEHPRLKTEQLNLAVASARKSQAFAIKRLLLSTEDVMNQSTLSGCQWLLDAGILVTMPIKTMEDVE